MNEAEKMETKEMNRVARYHPLICYVAVRKIDEELWRKVIKKQEGRGEKRKQVNGHVFLFQRQHWCNLCDLGPDKMSYLSAEYRKSYDQFRWKKQKMFIWILTWKGGLISWCLLPLRFLCSCLLSIHCWCRNCLLLFILVYVYYCEETFHNSKSAVSCWMKALILQNQSPHTQRTFCQACND